MSTEFEPKPATPAASAVEGHVFTCNNIDRFYGLLGTGPEDIPGFRRFGHNPVLAFDFIDFEIVYGADDYDSVEEHVADRFGDDYALRCTIIELDQG